jgi:hypothetical protein
MQAPVQFYHFQCFLGPPPSPPQPGYRSSALYGKLTHNGHPGMFQGPRGPHEQLRDVPVNMIASTARIWLAGCQDPHQVAAGIHQYAPLLRVQGWTLLISDCGKRGGESSRGVYSACSTDSRPVPVPFIDRHSDSLVTCGCIPHCRGRQGARSF